jgi:hypothetical protein
MEMLTLNPSDHALSPMLSAGLNYLFFTSPMEKTMLKISYRKCLSALVVGIISFVGIASSRAAISYTGTEYTQDFNSFAGGSWSNDSTLQGWSLFRRPTPPVAISSVTAGTGSSNAGAFYSFGLGDGDQALGGVGSGGTYWGSPSTGNVAGWMSVALTNNTGSFIDSFTVQFDGEQWRDGGNTSAQTMVFEYGFGASFDAVSWTAPGGSFDFVTPSTSGPAGARNGNDSAYRVADLGGEIFTGWSSGDTLWMRWIENNDAGNDHGLAIDDLSFSTGTVVEPPVDNADFDGDGDIDGRDFLTWQRGYGVGVASLADGDANGDEFVDGLDLGIWQTQYGTTPSLATTAVPEPTSMVLMLAGLLSLACRRK